MVTDQQWTDMWADPPSIYRSAPFWSWNERLDPRRLARQIEQMHLAGMGGFFMHSRYGLKTAYLSEEWFECVSACNDKARELGMKSYLYDEDRWPSGTAGGLVTRNRPEMALHLLVAADRDEFPERLQREAVFAVKLNADGALASHRLLEEDEPPGAAEQFVSFASGPAEDEPWFNDASYLDVFNPEAVREFIRACYQPYADRYGDEFGKLIPAVFTDEPNYGHGHVTVEGRLGTAPWSPLLPREFLKRRGYDLRDHLPELLYPLAGGAFSKVAHDYYRTLTELFVEGFSAQIGQWCERHGIALSGHYLYEGTCDLQMRNIGAAMPHYAQQQWPGIDILTDQREEISTVKQCSSVAAQIGRERVLSELYGCTGWDWPLEGHKFNAGWQYALGVNFRCPHLSHYSLAGGAKRDFPASIFPHSPWWKYYKVVEDYFARLSLALTTGRVVRDVLIIHPIESVYGLPWRGAQAAAIQQSLDALLEGLLDGHYDYDLGDESILAERAKAGKGELTVGEMSYRLAIVPPSATLRSSTVELLQRLADTGGAVIFSGRAPELIDCEADDGRLAELIARSHCCDDGAAATVTAIESSLPRRVSLAEGGAEAASAWTMLRKVTGGQLLFVQSHDREGGHDLHVSVEGREPVVLWDTQTGERRRLESVATGDRVQFDLCLPPTGSALVSLGLHVPEAAEPAPETKVISTVEAPGPWPVELLEPNTFPLDYCRVSIDGGQLSELTPVLAADEMVREHWGLGSRANRDCQPWYLAQTGRFDRSVRGAIEMSFSFHVTEAPARLAVAIERPGDFRITLNGRAVPSDPTGWWVDEDLETIDLTAAVQVGDNELVLAADYRSDMELEELHLVGDFGVRRIGERPVAGGYTLVAPTTELAAGSWVGQGLDFYGGAATYRLSVDESIRQAARDGRRVRLSLPGVKCTCAAVHVGDETFVLPWPPMTADITDALAAAGEVCDIRVEVIGGRKNILGPLHTPWEAWTGPDQFRPNNPAWADEYLLTDHGLTAPPVFEIVE